MARRALVARRAVTLDPVPVALNAVPQMSAATSAAPEPRSPRPNAPREVTAVASYVFIAILIASTFFV
ncbi:MAG: hypothetical protein AAF726_19055 [Planctomycetota bacterium]